MKMTQFEKLFVNREGKGKRNIATLNERLRQIDIYNISDVLEIGCGTGSVAAFLADRYGMNVVGTDFDPEEVNIARSLYGENDRLRFRVEDAAGLSFPDYRFDMVISQNVFHHIPNWPLVVREVSRVLRPNGYFIWLDFYIPTLLKKVLKPLGKSHGLYTLEDVKSALIRNRLEGRFERRTLYGPFPHREIVAQKV
jgi:ubiquinone/menaquinone biosynthesis C-methylase UbiE